MQYRVTCKREGDRWVSRDDNGHWRAYCIQEGSIPNACDAINAMFHRDEIVSIDVTSADEAEAWITNE